MVVANCYLLDTHTLIWWWTEPNQLSHTVLDIISNDKNNIVVSAASVWEMATKHRKGKLGQASQILQEFSSLVTINQFSLLSVTWQNAKRSGEFKQVHADPFDRMLAAQAQIENMCLLSCDEALSSFDVNILW